MSDSEFNTAQLRDGETRDDTAHAAGNLQALQDADDAGIDASEAIDELTAERDTFDCASCGDLYLDRGKALRCCSDGDGQGGEPA